MNCFSVSVIFSAAQVTSEEEVKVHKANVSLRIQAQCQNDDASLGTLRSPSLCHTKLTAYVWDLQPWFVHASKQHFWRQHYFNFKVKYISVQHIKGIRFAIFRPSIEKNSQSGHQTCFPICKWHVNLLLQPWNHHLNRALSKGHKATSGYGRLPLGCLEYKLRVCSWRLHVQAPKCHVYA